MSAAYSRKPIYDSTKHIVTLLDGTHPVGRIIFRDKELDLAQACLTAAAAIDTSDDAAVIAFVSDWHALRADAETTGGNGSGWQRADRYRPRRVRHTESET